MYMSLRVNYRHGGGIAQSAKLPRYELGSKVTEGTLTWGKESGREAPAGGEVKNAWSYTSIPSWLCD
jgi:hypothetical protein